VEFDDRSGRRTIKARCEVLLACGTYQSPQLLQLSGVGPAALLQGLGVDVVADRAEVGQNLQDHVLPPMAWRTKPGVFSYNRELGGAKLVWNVLRYLATRRGPMTIPAAEIGAFVKSDPALDQPDIQFHCLPITGELEVAARGEKSALSKHPGLTLGPYVMRPESRGTVIAANPDPFAPPHVVHNYLAASEDQRLTVRAMRIAREVAAAPALAALIEAESDPGPNCDSDSELLAYARAFGMTGYHPVGTCRMGSDEAAVCDPQLRVRGVNGLRVVDASVMPRLISGNTNATTAMIAEKAADMILGARA
jgi:choline dehydrogenase